MLPKIMQVINIHEAKTNLSKLIESVLAGQEIIIAKAGKPVAKLVGYKKKLKPRKLGLLKGKIIVSDDFNDEDPEINKMFYGSKVKKKADTNNAGQALLELAKLGKKLHVKGPRDLSANIDKYLYGE